MYLCLNKLACKVWKKNCPNFLYTMYKAGKKLESFSHSFLAVFPSLVVHQIFSFIFKQLCFLKKWLCIAGFLQSVVLYTNIRHDPRSEYNQWKNEQSKHQTELRGMGVFWDLNKGFTGRSTLRKLLDSTEHLDLPEIDLNVANIITIQDYNHKKT